MLSDTCSRHSRLHLTRVTHSSLCLRHRSCGRGVRLPTLQTLSPTRLLLSTHSTLCNFTEDRLALEHLFGSFCLAPVSPPILYVLVAPVATVASTKAQHLGRVLEEMEGFPSLWRVTSFHPTSAYLKHTLRIQLLCGLEQQRPLKSSFLRLISLHPITVNAL